MDEHLFQHKTVCRRQGADQDHDQQLCKKQSAAAASKKTIFQAAYAHVDFYLLFKNMLSLTDIEELFRPITQKHFSADSTLSLEDIYQEVFSLEKEQKNRLKEDLEQKFQAAQTTFSECSAKDPGIPSAILLYLSAFGFDIYLKKQMMEQLIDQMRAGVNHKEK